MFNILEKIMHKKKTQIQILFIVYYYDQIHW